MSRLPLSLAPANLPRNGFLLLQQPDHYDLVRIAATQFSTAVRTLPLGAPKARMANLNQ
jgi:hypothetical protein